MNKTIQTIAVLFMAISSAVEAVDVFEADFQASTPEAGTDAANVNAGVAIGSISGVFDGVAIFLDAGGNSESSDQALFLDQLPSGIALDANFDDPVVLDGAEFSFKTAHRRTQDDSHHKDVTITGYDAENSKSFEIVYQMDGSTSLGYVQNGTELVTVPAGSEGGMPWIPNNSDWFSTNSLGAVTVTCGATGYTIEFSLGPSSWKSAELPYNGVATTITKVSITGSSEAGIWFDDMRASGTVISAGPSEPTSITAVTTDEGGVEVAISFSSTPDTFYRIESSTDLTRWLEIQGNFPAAPDGEVSIFTTTEEAPAPQRKFYRVFPNAP